jgi:peptidyl-prolyl cis-trans isomerase SurA
MNLKYTDRSVPVPRKSGIRTLLLLLWCFPVFLSAEAQDTIIDGVIGIVGGNVVLKSDLEGQYTQFRQQGGITGASADVKCHILEGLLIQKLFYHEAQVDSVKVTDEEVDNEMDRRMRYFIAQLGSPDELEKYFGKSISELKAELRDMIKESMMSDRERAKVTDAVTITPYEVRSYYRKIPNDSIPEVPSEFEIGIIAKTPVIGQAERDAAIEKLKGIRERILKGDDFATLAVLYSEDPGSAKQGGELGFFQRGSMRPEFEAAAFKLKPGEVSDIVETDDGYHIIQLIERRGDFINVRHILIQPQVSLADMNKTRNLLDSVADQIRSNNLTFVKAVQIYSDDPTRNNEGMMINPQTRDIKFEAEDLDPKVFFVVDKMKVGEISQPVKWEERGKVSYRIYYLKMRTTPHKATLEEDYARIQDKALLQKQFEVLTKWENEKIASSYVWIAPPWDRCTFQLDWISK